MRGIAAVVEVVKIIYKDDDRATIDGPGCSFGLLLVPFLHGVTKVVENQLAPVDLGHAVHMLCHHNV